MRQYKAQVRLSNGTVTWIDITARSLSEAEGIASAYGDVIIVYNA